MGKSDIYYNYSTSSVCKAKVNLCAWWQPILLKEPFNNIFFHNSTWSELQIFSFLKKTARYQNSRSKPKSKRSYLVSKKFFFLRGETVKTYMAKEEKEGLKWSDNLGRQVQMWVRLFINDRCGAMLLLCGHLLHLGFFLDYAMLWLTPTTTCLI